MNQKTAKKIRRLAKRHEREVASQAIEQFFNFTLKPRPYWLPGKIWMWCLRRFLNI